MKKLLVAWLHILPPKTLSLTVLLVCCKHGCQEQYDTKQVCATSNKTQLVCDLLVFTCIKCLLAQNMAIKRWTVVHTQRIAPAWCPAGKQCTKLVGSKSAFWHMQWCRTLAMSYSFCVHLTHHVWQSILSLRATCRQLSRPRPSGLQLALCSSSSSSSSSSSKQVKTMQILALKLPPGSPVAVLTLKLLSSNHWHSSLLPTCPGHNKPYPSSPRQGSLGLPSACHVSFQPNRLLRPPTRMHRRQLCWQDHLFASCRYDDVCL